MTCPVCIRLPLFLYLDTLARARDTIYCSLVETVTSNNRLVEPNPPGIILRHSNPIHNLTYDAIRGLLNDRAQPINRMDNRE
jgi:hypothetical protein